MAAALNPSNAVPKRVLQISGELGKLLPVEQICWKRFDRGNVEDAVLIRAGSFLAFLTRLAYLLFTKRYRVLFFDDLRLLPLGVLVGKLTGASVIYNRQEVPTVELARTLARRVRLPGAWAWVFAEGVETFFGRRVHAVLTIPLSVDGIARLRGWGRPLATLWNVPEITNAAGPERGPSREPGMPATLIYSGAVSVENGLLAYLRLVRRLNSQGEDRKARLILIGRLWRSTPDELAELIQSESCVGLVEYRTWVPYDELLTLLSQADIGLALTDPAYEKHIHMGEGASRKVFTYMAAGLPVIAGGAFGRVAAEEGAGYFVGYEDTEALTEAVRRILSNPDGARVMGERGRQAILNKYNWEAEQSKITGILGEVVR